MAFDVIEVEQIAYKKCTRQWREIDLDITKLECNADFCPQSWNLDLDNIPNEYHFPRLSMTASVHISAVSSRDWRLGAMLEYSNFTETCIPSADFRTNHTVDLNTGESCQPEMKLLYTECQERITLQYQLPFPGQRKQRRTRSTLSELFESADKILAACSVEIAPMEVFDYCKDYEILVNMNNVGRISCATQISPHAATMLSEI